MTNKTTTTMWGPSILCCSCLQKRTAGDSPLLNVARLVSNRHSRHDTMWFLQQCLEKRKKITKQLQPSTCLQPSYSMVLLGPMCCLVNILVSLLHYVFIRPQTSKQSLQRILGSLLLLMEFPSTLFRRNIIITSFASRHPRPSAPMFCLWLSMRKTKSQAPCLDPPANLQISLHWS